MWILLHTEAMCGFLPTKSYSAFLIDQELLCELHTFLQSSNNENESSCETVLPPSKRIRLENPKEEAEEQTPNGSHQLTDAEKDGNVTDDHLRPPVCIVCLGILQELCEMDFVKAVSVSQSEVLSVSFSTENSAVWYVHGGEALLSHFYLDPFR